jgi:hypothetical protein
MRIWSNSLKGIFSKVDKMKLRLTILLTIILLGCALEPEKEIVFRDRVVETTIVVGDMPLLYSNANLYLGYSEWKKDYGITLWVIVLNISDSTWYGYPEVWLYSTEEIVEPDDTFADGDLICRRKGVLAIDKSYDHIPVPTEFIPANSHREAMAFVEIDIEELDPYYYVLWRFVER